MKKALLSLLLIAAAGITHAAAPVPDSSLNLLDKGLIANKLIVIKDKFYARDYRGALQLCREILTEDPKNATAHYRMAESYYELYEYAQGFESYTKAIESDPKVSKESQFLNARLNHRLGKLPEAQAALAAYKANLTEKEIKDQEVDLMEKQINTAIELTKKPVNVKITEMGENINSRQDDYSPMLSPDGKVMYLCSRRPNATGSNVSVDFKYFEDIYTSLRDESGHWQKAEAIDGKINTEEFDNGNYLTSDGATMYLTYNVYKWTKGSSSDIAIARMNKAGKWGLGKLIKSKEVNTTYFDACPTLPDAGDQMIFISERPNGTGISSDLWKITMRNGTPVGTAINLATLNTPYNETTPCITPDGKYMFFSSEGHGSMGGYDIFVSKFVEGNWSAPVNLGYPINSVDDDTHFKLSPDGTKAYFSSIRKEGTGGRDIYEIDLNGFDIYNLVK